MDNPPTPSRLRKGASRLRLLIPVFGVGLLIACVTLLLRPAVQVQTVSEVTRNIRDIALAASQPGAPRDAGTIGPWLVAAESYDPVSGHLINFRLTSGQTMLAAKRARIIIDPEADSFSFEMWDVVYMRVPTESDGTGEHTTTTDAFMWTEEHYILGPVQHQQDIVPDHTVAPSLDPWPPARDDDAPPPIASAE